MRPCKYCGKELVRKEREKISSWKTRKYCGRECVDKDKIGKPAWNSGKKLGRGFLGGKFIPCRICGKDTKYYFGEKRLHGKVHCGGSECAETSRQMKNAAIKEAMDKRVEDGVHEIPGDGWRTIAPVSQRERQLEPFMEALGFTPQYVIRTGTRSKFYRMDFAHLELQIDVEIDGSSHRFPTRREKDNIRNEWMERNGWRVLRIEDKIVAADIEGTKRLILETVNTRRSSLA